MIKPGRVGKHEPIDLIMQVTVCPPFILQAAGGQTIISINEASGYVCPAYLAVNGGRNQIIIVFE